MTVLRERAVTFLQLKLESRLKALELRSGLIPLALKPTFYSFDPLRCGGKTSGRWSAPNDMRKLAQQRGRKTNDEVSALKPTAARLSARAKIPCPDGPAAGADATVSTRREARPS